ncbi:MAG TPA: hypothetical protein PKY42_03470 [Mesotoga sp.]|nr:hypothetical protein [Mesotoga sp.]HQQ55614.1 hypothetical protein [Mesotoga sp.]
MADRSKKQSRTATKKNALDIINGNDALLILKALANEDRSIAKRIEQIALEYLRDVDFEKIASQVYYALERIEVEDLWDQSGRMRDGYVEPSERAWEMFEEALEPFTNELKKYLDLSLDNEAKNYCMGILKGLHRFDKESTSQFKDWVEDAPDEFFERILNDWKKACKKPEHIQEMEDFIERGLGN